VQKNLTTLIAAKINFLSVVNEPLKNPVRSLRTETDHALPLSPHMLRPATHRGSLLVRTVYPFKFDGVYSGIAQPGTFLADAVLGRPAGKSAKFVLRHDLGARRLHNPGLEPAHERIGIVLKDFETFVGAESRPFSLPKEVRKGPGLAQLGEAHQAFVLAGNSSK
jgi:hypothetical protein